MTRLSIFKHQGVGIFDVFLEFVQCGALTENSWHFRESSYIPPVI